MTLFRINAAFLPSIKDVFAVCDDGQIHNLLLSLQVKTDLQHTQMQGSSSRSPLYCAFSPTGTSRIQSTSVVLLLAKLFQRDFSLLYELPLLTLLEILVSENFSTFDSNKQYHHLDVVFSVLQGRGYPDTVLKSIIAAELSYTTALTGF